MLFRRLKRRQIKLGWREYHQLMYYSLPVWLGFALIYEGMVPGQFLLDLMGFNIIVLPAGLTCWALVRKLISGAEMRLRDAPLFGIFGFFVMFPLMIYSCFTCFKIHKWGVRSSGRVID